MRILHLSDAHISLEKIKASESIMTNLIKSLADEALFDGLDLVIFSGDAIHKGGGGLTIETFHAFEDKFVTPLLNSLKLGKERFIMVPGNHDIQRSKINSYQESGLRSCLIDEDSILGATAEPSNHARTEAYKEFESEFYKDALFEYKSITPFQSTFIVQIDNKKVGISALNSAWRCFDSKEDHRYNVIGEFQLIESLDKLNDCDLRIAISHHHFEYLKDFDSRKIAAILRTKYALYFTGHTHSPDFNKHEKPEGCLFNFVSSGIMSANIHSTDGKYVNGFTVTEYLIEEGQCKVYHYKQNFKGEFNKDLSFGDNGIWSSVFPIGPEAQLKRKVQHLLNKLQEREENYNQRLINYSTESKSPKTIREIFVMPVLTFEHFTENGTPQGAIDFTTIDSLKEVFDIEGNVLINGGKESGKSIILYRLLLEILNKRGDYNVVPIFLEFDKINNLEFGIRDFLGESKDTTANIMSTQNICLLIDNISFNRNKLKTISQINDLCRKYSKVKIIATRLNDVGFDVEGSIDLPIKFTSINIGAFHAKQVRSLAHKWFGENIDDDTYENNIEIVANLLASMNIPATPLAISMFLWILERDNLYRPQNRALLTKYFIEGLLKRDDVELYYREDFDTQNRMTLLAEIAMTMYRLKNDEGDLFLSHADIIVCIERHLNESDLDMFNATRVFNELIRSTILIEDSKTVRFRFHSFFEYFMAENIMRSEDFYDEVLKGNYLEFYNELNYYTGVVRSDKKYLQKIIDDLSNDFHDFKSEIIGQIGNIDEFFNTSKPLIGLISEDSFVEMLQHKENEEEREHRTDRLLTTSNTTNSLPSDRPPQIDNYLRFRQRLLLSMNLLRNAEELKDKDFRDKCYDIILSRTINLAIFSKIICVNKWIRMSEEERRSSDDAKTIFMFLRFFPYLHECLMLNNIASWKMKGVFERKIERDNATTEVSEFEKFLSVFLLADIEKKSAVGTVKDFCKQYKKSYITDSVYLKLYLYYYRQKNSNDSLVTLLADTYLKAQNRNTADNVAQKNKLIQRFRDEKRK